MVSKRCRCRGTFIVIALVMAGIIFVGMMFLASRGQQVQLEVRRLRDIREARRIGDCALTEGLAFAHMDIDEFKQTFTNGVHGNHDGLLAELHGKAWTYQPNRTLACIEEHDEGIFEVTKLEASIPDDTPITGGHTADVEVRAEVRVARPGITPYAVTVRSRRTFRISHCVMIIYMGRRANQYCMRIVR